MASGGFSGGHGIAGDAVAGVGEEVAVGVVREVLSPDEFVIQTSGDISGLDPALIYPAGAAAFDVGDLYYVSRFRGRLTRTPTEPAPGFASNAMILATGPTSGVVLQWQQTPNVVGRRPVGFNEFYYTATPGQRFTSADGSEFIVADVRPNQIIIEDAATGAVQTIPLRGPRG
jgi:hypothetical protein